MPAAPADAITYATRNDALDNMHRNGWRLYDAVPASLFTIAIRGHNPPLMLECDSTRAGIRRWWWRLMKEIP